MERLPWVARFKIYITTVNHMLTFIYLDIYIYIYIYIYLYCPYIFFTYNIDKITQLNISLLVNQFEKIKS